MNGKEKGLRGEGESTGEEGRSVERAVMQSSRTVEELELEEVVEEVVGREEQRQGGRRKAEGINHEPHGWAWALQVLASAL